MLRDRYPFTVRGISMIQPKNQEEQDLMYRFKPSQRQLEQFLNVWLKSTQKIAKILAV